MAGVTAMNTAVVSWIPVPVGADSRGPSFPQHGKIGTGRPHGWGKWNWLNKRIKSTVCLMNAYLRKASHPKASENIGVELCHRLASS